MWPSQRLASINLESWQRKSRTRRRNRRGIRPIVTLLEERFLLSTLNLTVTTLSDPAVLTGAMSLRQAINVANADTVDSQEVISFAANLQGTIDLTQALPNLANNISINGPGAMNLTVQRDPSAVAFSVFTVDSGETVSLSGITISGGSTTNGGGIYNNGVLTVANDIFTGNAATDSGGGIYNTDTLTVTNCKFTGNVADGGSLYGNGEGYVTSSFYGGGGIYSGTGSTLTVNNSTFTSNTTNGDGGGIYTSGTATINSTTFTGSIAACAGGIFNNGALTVTNSTFADSTGCFYGGGIWNAYDDGGGDIPQPATLTVTGCTFTSNAVDGWCSAGGAIFGGAPTGVNPITVKNSTFTDNSTNGDGYGTGGAIAGNVTVSGSTFNQ